MGSTHARRLEQTGAGRIAFDLHQPRHGEKTRVERGLKRCDRVLQRCGIVHKVALRHDQQIGDGDLPRVQRRVMFKFQAPGKALDRFLAQVPAGGRTWGGERGGSEISFGCLGMFAGVGGSLARPGRVPPPGVADAA